ncbi:hypothetical protein JUN65_03675 [Gluconacetobacter azotocaptans]|uniref:hypothetical protein n=1 Tax=Gluconacetobacter azotocaptans TaxID=142834 RepID=UPI001956EEF3|nr:hypothetical protein [Gluconacetobacter azotocaptans]MBM9400693.1 hypothetical protein [Gluconacetobacter azotocaptans]
MTVLDDLPHLVARMRAHGVRRLSSADDESALTLVLAPEVVSGPSPAAEISPPPSVTPVLSPEMGIFHPAGPVAERPVEQDEIVGFVEIGAVLLPVTAPRGGMLGHPLVEKGEVVGYHLSLFEIRHG